MFSIFVQHTVINNLGNLFLLNMKSYDHQMPTVTQKSDVV